MGSGIEIRTNQVPQPVPRAHSGAGAVGLGRKGVPFRKPSDEVEKLILATPEQLDTSHSLPENNVSIWRNYQEAVHGSHGESPTSGGSWRGGCKENVQAGGCLRAKLFSQEQARSGFACVHSACGR